MGSDARALIYVAIMVLLVGAAIAVGIVWWAIIVWTWAINPLWAIIVFLVWPLVLGGGSKVAKR